MLTRRALLLGTTATVFIPQGARAFWHGAPASVPSVNNGSFNAALPVTNGEVLGQMTASNFPTSWAITAGNSSGYFAINSSGDVSVTSAGASGITATTYSLTITATNAAGTSAGGTCGITVSAAATGFPGQAGNLVGYAATPANLSSSGSGTLINYGNAAYSSLTVNNSPDYTSSGTTGSPRVYTFQDFSSSGGKVISGNYITFIGCRFQSSNSSNENITYSGTHCTFLYCSVTPIAADWPTPIPSPAWPASMAGLQITSGVGNYLNYMVGPTNCSQYGITVSGTGPSLFDHCDLWGSGNAINYDNGSGGTTFDDCWIHDARSDSSGDHTDGPGYLNTNGAGPSNVTFNHCTLAGIGNTQLFAWQQATGGYNNIVMTNNYISGWACTLDFGQPGTQHGSGWVFTGNTLGTDIPWKSFIIYADFTTLFQTGGNSWSNNTLNILGGTSWIGDQGSGNNTGHWTSGMQGYYLWPNGTFNTTDFVP